MDTTDSLISNNLDDMFVKRMIFNKMTMKCKTKKTWGHPQTNQRDTPRGPPPRPLEGVAGQPPRPLGGSHRSAPWAIPLFPW